MKLQKEQSKIKSRINYSYYIDVLINAAIYGGIFFITLVMFINAIKIIINMLIKL
jgi:hypothetical protein